MPASELAEVIVEAAPGRRAFPRDLEGRLKRCPTATGAEGKNPQPGTLRRAVLRCLPPVGGLVDVQAPFGLDLDASHRPLQRHTTVVQPRVGVNFHRHPTHTPTLAERGGPAVKQRTRAAIVAEHASGDQVHLPQVR